MFQLLIQRTDDGAYMVIVNSGLGDESKIIERESEVKTYVTKEISKWVRETE